MKKGLIGNIIIVSGMVLFFGLLGYAIWGSNGHPYEVIEEFPIYKAILPFGIIQYQERGGGSLFAFSFIGSSKEVYYIKYMEGTVLKSLELTSTSTGLIIDGKFIVEKRAKWFWNEFGERGPITWQPPIYLIHIPKLPELNQTWIMDWSWNK